MFSEALPVLDIPLQVRAVSGKADPAYAGTVVRWIETAVGLALSGEVSGLVTAPIAKAPLYEAGFEFPGTDPTITGYQAVVELDTPEKLTNGWHRTPRGLARRLRRTGEDRDRYALRGLHRPAQA